MEKKSYSNRILIVDDIPKNLQVLGSILAEKNFQIEFALDGLSALKWIEKKDFDLILLDIMMPGMTGFEVCKHIRLNEKYNDLPIIFLTAKVDTESIVEGFQLGGQDYISKPFDSNELLARVNTHLELKNARDQLKNMNVVLQQKVAERTQELEQANLKLTKLDEAKTTFINIISHEIRTPLNGILGSLSLMSDPDYDEETKMFLEMLNISAKRLENFSIHILDISLLSAKGSDALVAEPVDMSSVLADSLEVHQEKLDEKNILVESHLESVAMFKADTDYLTKVNSMLLDNAITFSPNESTISLKIWQKDYQLHFRIMDQGKGFEEGFKINEILPFTSREHVDQNPGLSLYLCRLIIEAHGGEIWNGNNPEKGAFVEYQIPMN